MRILLLTLLLSISCFAQEIVVAPLSYTTSTVVTYLTLRDTIKANNRDAMSFGTTELLTSGDYSGYLTVGKFGATVCQAGYEFQLNVAKSATVDSAYLYLYIGGNYAGSTDTIWHSVYDVDNAAVFNAADGHALTSHATVWTGGTVALTGVASHPYDTYRVTVTALVQHIINRSGWSSGNYIGFVAAMGTTFSNDEFTNIWNYEGANTSRTPRIVVYAH